MTKNEAIEYFGSVKKLSLALKITVQGIYKWGKYPPPLRQYQIEILTKRKLKAEAYNNDKK